MLLRQSAYNPLRYSSESFNGSTTVASATDDSEPVLNNWNDNFTRSSKDLFRPRGIQLSAAPDQMVVDHLERNHHHLSNIKLIVDKEVAITFEAMRLSRRVEGNWPNSSKRGTPYLPLTGCKWLMTSEGKTKQISNVSFTLDKCVASSNLTWLPS